MKASESKLLDVLRTSPQFVIPIYQRTYSWTARECLQLWNDVVRAGKNNGVSAHFVGSIVYIQTGLANLTNPASQLVIDGQQRLTTVSLLIAALARAVGDTEPMEGFSADELRESYLINRHGKGERRYKLLLSQTDKDTLTAIVDGRDLPAEFSFRVRDSFTFFEERIAAYKDDLATLCVGLAKLVVVDISLNRDQDNPQLIFESMNSTGRELSQADLIRNYVLMGLEPDLQKHLYDLFWRPMEMDFGQEAYSTQFDGFMRHYLTVKTGNIPRVGEVYEAFKTYARSPAVAAAGVQVLVQDLRAYARHFCAMVLVLLC